MTLKPDRRPAARNAGAVVVRLSSILRDADTTRSGERPQLARILEGGGADLSPSHAVSVE
jgi:hypothetical protein